MRNTFCGTDIIKKHFFQFLTENSCTSKTVIRARVQKKKKKKKKEAKNGESKII